MKFIMLASLFALTLSACATNQSRSRAPSSANDDYAEYFKQASKDQHDLEIYGWDMIVCVNKEDKKMAAAVIYIWSGITTLITYDTGEAKVRKLESVDQYSRKYDYRLGHDKYQLKIGVGDRTTGNLTLIGAEGMRTELNCAAFIDEYRGG